MWTYLIVCGHEKHLYKLVDLFREDTHKVDSRQTLTICRTDHILLANLHVQPAGIYTSSPRMNLEFVIAVSTACLLVVMSQVSDAGYPQPVYERKGYRVPDVKYGGRPDKGDGYKSDKGDGYKQKAGGQYGGKQGQVNDYVPNRPAKVSGKEDYNNKGYDKGVNNKGSDNNGYDNKGVNNKRNDNNGYDYKGVNNNGYDNKGVNNKGYDNNGYDNKGVNNKGYDNNGYDNKGANNKGYDNNRYDNKGANNKGYDDKVIYNKDVPY